MISRRVLCVCADSLSVCVCLCVCWKVVKDKRLITNHLKRVIVRCAR
jgi:hypothetical protein